MCAGDAREYARPAPGNGRPTKPPTLEPERQKRPRFGTRTLADPAAAFEHNAWCASLSLSRALSLSLSLPHPIKKYTGAAILLKTIYCFVFN